MNKLRVGINGFGRIGRAFTRIASMQDTFDIVMINTRKSTPEALAYMLKYDSVYRKFGKEVTFDEENIYIDGKKILCSHFDDPSLIDWNSEGVNIVVDATGAFKTKEALAPHLGGSVQRVILTAPAKDDTDTIVLGCSREKEFSSQIISNASCTTNAATPLLKILDDAFGIESGTLTTTHAYTASQPLVDEWNKDFTRSRAAALSIVPTTTGAANAVVKILPHLNGKIDGMAIRVPVPTGSFVDITVIVKSPVSIDSINETFEEKSKTTMTGIIKYETDAIVSSDIIASPYSVVFDSNYTNVVNGNLVKIYGWYDNEWGYSNRLVDLITKLG